MILTFLMICSSSCRWADLFSAPGCKDTPKHDFSHPFLQVIFRFWIVILSVRSPLLHIWAWHFRICQNKNCWLIWLCWLFVCSPFDLFFAYVLPLFCTHTQMVSVPFIVCCLFLQAVCMFLGELSCLAVFYILLCYDRRKPEPSMEPGQSFNPLLFLPPALCDMLGTSIMYVGK